MKTLADKRCVIKTLWTSALQSIGLVCPACFHLLSWIQDGFHCPASQVTGKGVLRSPSVSQQSSPYALSSPAQAFSPSHSFPESGWQSSFWSEFFQFCPSCFPAKGYCLPTTKASQLRGIFILIQLPFGEETVTGCCLL